MSNSADRLKPGFSLYCDTLRIAAAFIVLLVHTSWGNISGGFLWQLRPLAYPAVIVFFVLSGYIIAYVSSTREASLAEYSAARLARLYSVLLPAIALTLVLDFVGRAHNPLLYHGPDESTPLLRALSALLFLSQSWNAHLELLSNTSYWSLPYEFWYYVIFGAAFFLTGKTRLIAVALSALIAGPGILLMFPIWYAGVASFAASRKVPRGKYAGGIYFSVSIALTAIGIVTRENGMFPIHVAAYLPFNFSIANYIIAAGVALNLYAASGFEIAFLRRLQSVIRPAAGMTFSLYLFHAPILSFVAAFLPSQMSTLARAAILIATALTVCAILSRYTEDRKGALKNGFTMLFKSALRAIRESPYSETH